MKPDLGHLAAVLWDMDGTIIDSEPLWITCQIRLVSEFGRIWTFDDGLSYVGSPMGVTAAALQSAGVQLSESAIRRRLTAEVTTSLRTSVPWRPGVVALIEALITAGIPQGLVTTSPRSMAQVVLDALPSRAMAAVVSGDDVTQTKPHPEPYLSALDALRLDPRRCLAIEDSAAGAASAVAAGINVLLIPNGTRVPESPQIARLKTLANVGITDLASIAEGTAAVVSTQATAISGQP